LETFVRGVSAVKPRLAIPEFDVPRSQKAEALSPSAAHRPVCVLDDDPVQVGLLTEMLEGMGLAVCGTTHAEEALTLIRAGTSRVVLADVRMPEMDGFTFLEQALTADPGLYVLLISGEYSLEGAVEAIRRGAYDYLAKPLERGRLQKSLEEVHRMLEVRQRTRELEQQLVSHLEFHGIIGRSPAMLEVFEMVQKVARHFSNVLITGPTGSGKELVAHALHKMSPVAQQQFAVCNCSALVDTLLESQLFGHVRGAFTGATETRAGLFEYAQGGAVFLDEISEMGLPMQAKLLRVIQNREIQRVGSPEVKRVNVRLIAASNRDLRAEVLAGRFREDLFYRHPHPRPRPGRAAGGCAPAHPVFPAPLQRDLRKKHPGPDAARAGHAAAALLAGQRPRTGERDFQRGHAGRRQLH
jgi:DNA-binding NtrC family response regulator